MTDIVRDELDYFSAGSLWILLYIRSDNRQYIFSSLIFFNNDPPNLSDTQIRCIRDIFKYF